MNERLLAIERDDPDFVKDLLESQGAVWMVARWLHGRGHSVSVRAVRIRPEASEMNDYSDDGDIEISQIVQVKQRNLDFTSAADYPYATITVDVAHTWDRAVRKPSLYVILNRAGDYVACINGSTSASWQRVTKMDRRKNREREFLECPTRLAVFKRFDINDPAKG